MTQPWSGRVVQHIKIDGLLVKVIWIWKVEVGQGSAQRFDFAHTAAHFAIFHAFVEQVVAVLEMGEAQPVMHQMGVLVGLNAQERGAAQDGEPEPGQEVRWIRCFFFPISFLRL